MKKIVRANIMSLAVRSSFFPFQWPRWNGTVLLPHFFFAEFVRAIDFRVRHPFQYARESNSLCGPQLRSPVFFFNHKKRARNIIRLRARQDCQKIGCPISQSVNGYASTSDFESCQAFSMG